MHLQQGFKAAVAAIGISTLSACSPPPTETQKPRDDERRLTQGEVSMAQEIFGDQINYNRIFITQNNSKDISKVISGRIRMSQSHYRDDYSKTQNAYAISVFMHEMTHIWQEQRGVNLADNAISLFFEHGGDYSQSYEYTAADLPNFRNLSIEQQGEIIEDYTYMRTVLRDFNTSVFCPEILRYETALKPIFPTIQTPNLCR